MVKVIDKIDWNQPQPFDVWRDAAWKSIRRIARRNEIGAPGKREAEEAIARTVQAELLLKLNYANHYVEQCVPVLDSAGVYERIADFIGPSDTVIDFGSGPGTIRKYLSCEKYFGFDNNPFCLNYAKQEYPDSFFYANAGWDTLETRLQFNPKETQIPLDNTTYFLLKQLVCEFQEYQHARQTRVSKFIQDNKLHPDCFIATFNGSSSAYRTGRGSDLNEAEMFELGVYANAALCLPKDGRLVVAIRTYENIMHLIAKSIGHLNLRITKSAMVLKPAEPENPRFVIEGAGPKLTHYQILEIRKAD